MCEREEKAGRSARREARVGGKTEHANFAHTNCLSREGNEEKFRNVTSELCLEGSESLASQASLFSLAKTVITVY